MHTASGRTAFPPPPPDPGQKGRELGGLETHTRAFKLKFIHSKDYPKFQGHIHFDEEFKNQGKMMMTLKHSSFEMPSTTFL